jgi:hypothetical protein
VSDILIRARERTDTDGWDSIGSIPWEWIVAEHERTERIGQWDDPADFLKRVRQAYRKDLWTLQPVRPEVWSEKGTVRGILRPIADDYGITIRIFGGWGGGTTVHDTAEEISNSRQPIVPLYVGDLDCSGAYMSDVDLPQRLRRYGATNVEIRRIAVIPEQTRGLPSFPATAKAKDSRYHWFVQKYGRRCYELDAMDPRVLRRLVEREIQSLIEPNAWERGLRAGESEARSLKLYLDGWHGVKA